MTYHYAIESIDGFSDPHMVPVCGYNFHGRKKLTEDWRKVDCQTCLRLSGFAEQFTSCESDPLLRRRA